MLNSLMKCLRTYKECIISGNVPEGYEEKANVVLQEINNLEEMVNQGQVLNDYDFKSLKRDVGSIFHSDHFKGADGIVDNVDSTLGTFFGALSEIDKALRSGYTLKSEEMPEEDKTTTSTARRRSNYQPQSQQRTGNSFVTFVSERFNALFKNIPSDENDYVTILAKLTKKLDTLRAQFSDNESQIQFLRTKLETYNNERYLKTSPESIDEEYEKMCSTLYSKANRLYGERNRASKRLNDRYNELVPLMDDRQKEWEYRYSSLIKERNQLTKDYENALRNNDRRQVKFLLRRLSEINKSINTEETTLSVGVKDYFSEEVTEGDYQYTQLQQRLEELEKRFAEADRKYTTTLNTPSETKERIRRSIDAKYTETIKNLFASIAKFERKSIELQDQISEYEGQIETFKSRYSNFRPKRRKR